LRLGCEAALSKTQRIQEPGRGACQQLEAIDKHGQKGLDVCQPYLTRMADTAGLNGVPDFKKMVIFTEFKSIVQRA
jgi:hypothetical protein